MFGRERQRPGLEWGIRESLTAYVAHLPDGVISVDEIADFVPKTHPPRFFFPLISLSPEEARFAGSARIAGHGGMLIVIARSPYLHIDGDHVQLSVESADGRGRLTVAELDRDGLGVANWQDATARLTVDGAAWLGPNYSAGDSVSPLTYRATARSSSR